MADPFRDIRRRVARAGEHAKAFFTTTSEFLTGDCGEVFIEPPSDGAFNLHKFRLKEPLPSALEDLAFDILGNLRAALDQCGYATATLAGVHSPTNCKFPFGPTELKMEENIKGRCKDLPPEVAEIFRSFSPYKEGNDALWALNELANTNKHKLLVPVAIYTQEMAVNWIESNSEAIFYEPHWDSEKDEVTIARIAAGTELEFDLNFEAFVAFNHPDIPKSAPAGDIFNAMGSQVSAVVEATEAGCRDLGLI